MWETMSSRQPHVSYCTTALSCQTDEYQMYLFLWNVASAFNHPTDDDLFIIEHSVLIDGMSEKVTMQRNQQFSKTERAQLNAMHA